METINEQAAWNTIDRTVGLEAAARRRKAKWHRDAIKIAVVDTGVMRGHVALKFDDIACSVVVERPNGHKPRAREKRVDDDVTRSDSGAASHGTRLAGLIAAVTGNAVTQSPTRTPVELLAVKFFTALDPLSATGAAAAIRHAVDRGARIVNLSWDVTMDTDHAVKHAIEHALERRVLVVVAAGHNSANIDSRLIVPASYDLPNVLTVMAIGGDLKPIAKSNRGPLRVGIAAPGKNLTTTRSYLPGSRNSTDSNCFGTFTGTSAATAMVTGVAAVVLSCKPNLDPAALRKVIEDSAIQTEALTGACRANGYVSLSKAVALL